MVARGAAAREPQTANGSAGVSEALLAKVDFRHFAAVVELQENYVNNVLPEAERAEMLSALEKLSPLRGIVQVAACQRLLAKGELPPAARGLAEELVTENGRRRLRSLLRLADAARGARSAA